jgi:hypothetical protein
MEGVPKRVMVVAANAEPAEVNNVIGGSIGSTSDASALVITGSP